MNKRITIASWLLLFGIWVTRGATYYVATSGNDANGGSQTRPFRTVQKAVDTMRAGDSCVVSPGTYSERVSTVRHGRVCAPVRLTAQRGAIVTGGFYVSHRHTVIDGFEISPGPSARFTGVIQLTKAADNVQIINNYLHDTLDDVYGILFGFSVAPDDSNKNCIISNNIVRRTRYQMITMYGADNQIVNNTFESSNAGDALRVFGRDILVRANYFTNISAVSGITGNHPDLIQTFGDGGSAAYNVTFESNLAEDCVAQFCQLEQKGVADMRDWTFRNNLFVRVLWAANIDMEGVRWHNNTFYQCTTNTGHPLFFNDVSKGRAFRGEARNNVFIECGSDPTNTGRGWYYVDPTLTDFIGNNNFVCGPGFAAKRTGSVRDATTFVEANGINGGDPGLMSVATRDFRLKNSSVLIGRGAVLSGVVDDFDSLARPQGTAPDIGAFEYTSGTRPTRAIGSNLNL